MDFNTFYKINYGLYIVSSIDNGEKQNALIANVVFQVTADPPTIGVSINKNSLTHEYIKNSKVFAISIVTQDASMKFIGNFGFKTGRDIDKFENVNIKKGQTNCPIIIDNCNAFVEARVINIIDCGTHEIIIGSIVDAQILNDNEGMVYEYYRKIKGGKSAKGAPTYINEKTQGDERL